MCSNATRDTDTGVCSYTVQGIEFDASAGDPCGIATFTNDYNGTGTLAGEVLPLGDTTVVWTVTDTNGNTDTCTTVITVEDNEAPVVTCPANITQDTDLGLCGATVTFTPTATDNCGVASIVSVPASGSFFPLGTTTVTVTATDDTGNPSICTFDVTIEDNTPPTLTCVPNATRDTDAGVCSYTVQGIEFDASAGDPCGIATFTNDYNGTGTLAGEVLPLGDTAVVWTVTDTNGNTDTCTTVITVEDNEAPVITCVANGTRDTNPGVCEYTVIGNEFDATFTDNCTSGAILNSLNGTSTLDGVVLPIGDTTVTWLVNDGNGNTATCSVTITVEDNEDPVITCAMRWHRDTDPGVCEYTVQGTEFDATFTDNCTGGYNHQRL